MDDDAEYQKLRRNMQGAQGSREGHPGSNDVISTVIYSAEGEEVTILGDPWAIGTRITDPASLIAYHKL